MLKNSGRAKSARRFHIRELGRIEGAGHRGLSGWEHPAQTEHHPAHVARLAQRARIPSPEVDQWWTRSSSTGAIDGNAAASTDVPPGVARRSVCETACGVPVRQCHRRTLSPQNEPPYPPGSHIPCAPGATAQGSRPERPFYAKPPLAVRLRGVRNTRLADAGSYARVGPFGTRSLQSPSIARSLELSLCGHRPTR
jgi:hypothetical protein